MCVCVQSLTAAYLSAGNMATILTITESACSKEGESGEEREGGRKGGREGGEREEEYARVRTVKIDEGQKELYHVLQSSGNSSPMW